jgi:hypothetical protein
LLDPAAELEVEFRYSELPFELELDSAAQLPGGDHVVRLVHPDFRAPEPVALPDGEGQSGGQSDDETGDETGEDGETSKAASGGSGPGGPMSFKPWTPPEIDFVKGTPPTEVFFVFPKSPSGAALAFNGPDGDGDGGGGGGGGRGGMGGMMMAGPGKPILLDGGDLDWGSSQVGYRHERTFGADTAKDEFRVNLSRSGRYCVLVVRWPENHSGSVGRVLELLAPFARVEP